MSSPYGHKTEPEPAARTTPHTGSSPTALNAKALWRAVGRAKPEHRAKDPNKQDSCSHLVSNLARKALFYLNVGLRKPPTRKTRSLQSSRKKSSGFSHAFHNRPPLSLHQNKLAGKDICESPSFVNPWAYFWHFFHNHILPQKKDLQWLDDGCVAWKGSSQQTSERAVPMALHSGPVPP